MTMNDIMSLVGNEMDYGYSHFGTYHNSHEHYAVLQEEVDEWWDAVKRNNSERELYELIQVAAVALRYVIENAQDIDLEKVQRLRHES